MKIIDADCHISPTSEGHGLSITIDELLRRMDRSGVDQALTWLQPPYLRYTDDANAYVYKAMQDHPDRILGFGWADPNLGVDQAKDTVKRCIEDYGFFGVKLNGAQNQFYIDDPELSIPVIEEIAKTGKLLAFHCGGDAYENTHPFRVAKIAKLFPDLQILMVHMGGVAVPNLSNAAIEFAEQCPNITLVASEIKDLAVYKAVNTLGAQRVCFGSDSPFSIMHCEVAKYKAMFEEELSPDDYSAFFGGNIARLFGLN